MTPKAYLDQVKIALDQLGNALAAGMADETISSRLEHEDIVPVLGPAVRYALNKVFKGHTAKALEYDDLGLPDPHQLPSLAAEAFAQVMRAGDAYLSLPEAQRRMAEGEAKRQRLREECQDAGEVPACKTCGRYL